mmetsp:Transcript_93450/g.157082  ORF Transcript_93450/g.157082 Transcript_93450/m.157082 type:complete len:88 (-) Transcript_93450:15-278(-)
MVAKKPKSAEKRGPPCLDKPVLGQGGGVLMVPRLELDSKLIIVELDREMRATGHAYSGQSASKAKRVACLFFWWRVFLVGAVIQKDV